jgi:hypothetical protein
MGGTSTHRRPPPLDRLGADERDGDEASGFEPELRLGAEPVAPDPELGRVAPWPGVVGRWVTVWPLRVRDGGSATR